MHFSEPHYHLLHSHVDPAMQLMAMASFGDDCQNTLFRTFPSPSSASLSTHA